MADLYRLLFALPFVVDLGGSLGTISSEPCDGDVGSIGVVCPGAAAWAVCVGARPAWVGCG